MLLLIPSQFSRSHYASVITHPLPKHQFVFHTIVITNQPLTNSFQLQTYYYQLPTKSAIYDYNYNPSPPTQATCN